MKATFYKINHGYDNPKVKKADKIFFTFAVDEEGNTYMPVSFFEHPDHKLYHAMADGVQVCRKGENIFLDTGWLAENYSDARPYINKLHQIAGSAELCAS